jgi:polyhydroxyalkanoate synthesis regulator phasin
MASKKRSTRVSKVRASVRKVRREGEHLVERLRGEASKLVARSRAEVVKDIRAVRGELQDRADRAVRDLERKVVRQFHAATEEQVRRLERRVAKLEQRITELSKAVTTAGSDKAA